MVELKTWAPKPAVGCCIGWRAEGGSQDWHWGSWMVSGASLQGGDAIRTGCRLEGHECGHRMDKMG